MSTLINTFKKEHEIIISELNEVTKLGINTKEGQTKLLNVKDTLITHLQKEDDLFYPVLRKKAKINENLKKILEEFSDEMEKISVITNNFFEKYSKGGSGFEFSREFGNLYGVLGKRIKNEESVLYKFYEDLQQK